MLDDLEALIALRQHGTMTRAATALRLTQSAISKRIASLSDELGTELLRPLGRRVQLTPFAADLVERTTPLLAELRQVMTAERSELSGELQIAVSESVLASWGPRLLARVRDELPGVRFIVAAHRSPVAIDLARAGEVSMALVAGLAEGASGLVAQRVGEEPMVIVTRAQTSSARPRRRDLTNDEGALEVMTIEPHSATWQSLEARLRGEPSLQALELRVGSTLQSFSALAQMARAGFGHALVPIGVASSMRSGGSKVLALPSPGLSRPISLVGRARTLDGALASRVASAIAAHAPGAIPAAPADCL